MESISSPVFFPQNILHNIPRASLLPDSNLSIVSPCEELIDSREGGCEMDKPFLESIIIELGRRLASVACSEKISNLS